MRRALIFVLVSVVMGIVEAEARRATPDDLGSVIEFDRRWFDARADGRFTLTSEYQVRIVNEQGRDSQGEQALAFNAGASRLKVLAARVINDGVATSVPKSSIEVREVGENIKVFDQQKQTVISFPNVRLGSRLYVKYEIRFDEVPIPDQFSMSYDDGGLHTEELSVEILSDRPLHFWASDPQGHLKMETGRSGRRYKASVRSTRALEYGVTDEEFMAEDPAGSLAFAFSTVQEWSKFSPSLMAEIESLSAEALPESLRQFISKVDPKAPAVERLNLVTAWMSEEFRYFGDWRRRKGTHLPRTLTEIVSSRYGDCKDLSLIAVAMYRALGFRAHQAWIYRGAEPLNPGLMHLPTDQVFNHAIARVEAEGKVYWIDPTNPVSFAQGIFIDIADRPAFVLDPAHPHLDSTPKMKAEESVWSTDMHLRVGKDEVLVKGKVRASGRMAISMAINNFFYSPESNDYWLIRWITGSDSALSFKVGDYERKSRVVGDLGIDVRYSLADIGMRTSAGIGFPLPKENLVDRLLVDVRNRISGIWLDGPARSLQRNELANVRIVGREKLDCTIESPWAALSRRVQESTTGVVITDRIESRRRMISVTEHQSPEFAKLQKRLRDCFYRSAVVLRSR